MDLNACTLWFDHIGPWNWNVCCKAHDLAYASGVAKAIADANLEHCVNQIFPLMGVIMWVGVTLFGGMFYWKAARKLKDNK